MVPPVEMYMQTEIVALFWERRRKPNLRLDGPAALQRHTRGSTTSPAPILTPTGLGTGVGWDGALEGIIEDQV